MHDFPVALNARKFRSPNCSSRDACASRERPGAAFVQRRVRAAQARREQAAGPDAAMALRTQACCEPSRRRSAPGR